MKLMQDHLKPKPLTIAERFRFHKRVQKEGESIAQFVAELRKLAEQCDFKEYLEEAIRDRLVCGIRNEAIQRKLLSEEDLTLKKAFEVASGMELVASQATSLHQDSVHGDQSSMAVKKIQMSGAKKNPQRHSQKKPLSKTQPTCKCYRCGKEGHSQEKCFYKDKTCNSCGHIARVCRQNTGDAPNRPQSTRYIEQSGDRSESPLQAAIYCLKEDQVTGHITVNLMVNEIALEMEVDTGASVTII